MKKYFYKINGKLLPYHYCSECNKQYTNSDAIKGLIVNIGTSKTPLNYCASPCLKRKFPQPISKKSHTKSIKYPNIKQIETKKHLYENIQKINENIT